VPNPPLYVRDAGRDDVEALSSVGTDSFLDAYAGTSEPKALAEHLDALFGVDSIAAEMARTDCWYKLALVGDAATGLLKLRLRNPPGESPRRQLIEIQQLYVHSDYQGYGVGRALIDAAVRHARDEGVDAIWLQVWSQADWAIPFYERNLFVRVGEIPYHIGDQVYDDWLMVREL
jgi:ribosomal protein S18 acetylase RimI-like enzyme